LRTLYTPLFLFQLQTSNFYILTVLFIIAARKKCYKRFDMAAQIIDGKAIAESIKQQLRDEISALKQKGIVPRLATVLVGSDAGSRIYAENQAKTSHSIGIEHSLVSIPETISQDELLAHIEALNTDPAICGILLSMPLPKGIDAGRIQNAIAAAKDVEGVGAANMGAVIQGDFSLAPCTAAAAHACIKSQSLIPIKGAEIVIVGRSAIVGKPLAMMLVWDHATVTICHTATKNLVEHCRRADILVAAAGRAGLITSEHVRPGAVVIDVGINRVTVTDAAGQKKSRTVGDVDFESASSAASLITPVPGGVGPVTVAMLLRNTVNAAKKLKS
jgi:methylenetetrahydrofolate dehydrogenase (NADP+)/methenyltetrahydrofolate cyclohydrolase